MQLIQNYINGKLIAPVSENYIDNYEPATGKVYAKIPDSDERDVELAINAAENAFEAWSQFGHDKRGKILMRIADLLQQNINQFAEAESRDNGKPLQLAKRMDIPRAVDNFRFFGSAVMHFASESHFMEKEGINYTLRRPIGIVGCISPWNLPLYLFSWKIAPALAAGNCVVAKPSEITPMTAYMLSNICNEAGLPAGVLNIVHGLGSKAGKAIVEHPKTKAISFTGGTKTGEWIAASAAPKFKKLSLELGGKNANIIFADCDFENAVKTSVNSAFLNQGQICLCGSRIFIERSIYNVFANEFVNKVKQLKIGDPLSDVNIGAVVSEAHLQKIVSYTQLALSEGGKILCGGKIYKTNDMRTESGYYFEPTVIENLDFNCRTNQEEIFGPIVTLTPFDTIEEVLQMANSTEYGLAASVWTQNLRTANYVSEKLQTGIVWVNCWLLRDLRTPFGGVKNSGIGREGGWEALRFFTEPKNVCIKYY